MFLTERFSTYKTHPCNSLTWEIESRSNIDYEGEVNDEVSFFCGLYRGVSVLHEKSKLAMSKTSVYATSVDLQKHRCDLQRYRATRMLIRLAPPSDFGPPREMSIALMTSVSPRWSVKRECSSSIDSKTRDGYTEITRCISICAARVSIFLLPRIIYNYEKNVDSF